ncbi:alpha/beta hydrolase family protein [Priestia koreensis]|uniref:alpha/beta hydrolase family protein n=1 Tax=Priestia koreensis TaxID=284581 RepID=UPI00203E7D88|nr:alpha/beta hydrolase [Priestia koreensis]MCM3005137.1 alpha/beta hydrolase [Priestia koreensis]
MKNSIEHKKFAGFRKVDVTDEHLGLTFPMLVLYPTDQREEEENIGPYKLNVSMHAEVIGGVPPLVIISHGSGGTPLVYRDLARSLAQNGFIVAMPEHPFNNIHDNHLANSASILESRPRNITRVIDWFYSSGLFKHHVHFDDISIIGHSMGGYTAIALVGGIPTTLPWETENQMPKMIDVEADERIKKVILLAPALGWFRSEGALKEVRIPILMITGERDDITPSFHAEFLLKGITNREQIEHKVIKNAGHFSFLSPFPLEMRSSSFPPSQDPKEFNRELFQQQLTADILSFLSP